ncbi:hypothetical protein PoB_004266600 [Plakobranchus ocellatus]|uniref:Uncharacterized protein n=1 Tax=Plakobranchus ocellatus TaxID=259542 RepID=A0AAV4B6T0_9GAST|nr:hypothetical protein PoB_004266600 [Plakobranchus ocellatus]
MSAKTASLADKETAHTNDALVTLNDENTGTQTAQQGWMEQLHDMRGVGGIMASESALRRFAGILLSRFRVPPRHPGLTEGLKA